MFHLHSLREPPPKKKKKMCETINCTRRSYNIQSRIAVSFKRPYSYSRYRTGTNLQPCEADAGEFFQMQITLISF